MQLTEKCKEDFLKYLKELPIAPYEVMLDQIPICYLNSLILEFFDAANININIEVIYDRNSGYVRGFDSEVIFIMHGDLMVNNSNCLKEDIYESRLESIEKAVIKANEIYNQLYERR